MAQKKKGVEIDLRESKKSVEQALRELKTVMQDDIDQLKERRFRLKPAEIRRQKKKKKRANIRSYNKNN